MMKKMTTTTRKHGLKARLKLAAGAFAPETGNRPRTRLAFETVNQAYLWITDRGRARLIKH